MEKTDQVIQASVNKIMRKEYSKCEKHDLEFELTYSTFLAHLNPDGKRSHYFGDCPECEKEREEKEESHRRDMATKRRQEEINSRLNNAMIKPRFKEKSFDNFHVDSDRQRKAFDIAKCFVDHMDNSSGLIFIGSCGTGKNHLACAIVKDVVLRQSKTALITTAIKIIRRIKESWAVDGERESDIIHDFATIDLLVIDEVGVQFGSETEKLYLTEIINERYEHMKPTIMIANLTMSQLTDTLGERIIERFKEGGKVVVFNWESYRGKA